MFPQRLALLGSLPIDSGSAFHREWIAAMQQDCHRHSVWNGRFVRDLSSEESPATEVYNHTCRSHFWLAVRLARVLGVTDAEIERIKPLPEAQKYTDEHFRECSQGEFGFAFGMICLIEEFTTPEFTRIFKAFLRSCKAGMGMEPSDFILKGGAEYFTANIADDERHREDMPRLVATWLCANGVDLSSPSDVSRGLEQVRAGARYSADLRAQFFEDIFRFVSDGGTFRDLVR